MKFKLFLFFCFALSIPHISFGTDKKCAGEGMDAGGSTLSALQCCPGLIATNSWVHEYVKEGRSRTSPPGSGGSCVKCGDGKCDSKNFENKCNCPKDCN